MVAVEDFKLAAVYVWKENSGLAWGKETEGGRRGEVGAPTRNLPSSWDFEDNLGVTELTKESDQNKWTFPVAQWLGSSLQMQGAGLQSLGRELRSHKLQGMPKK